MNKTLLLGLTATCLTTAALFAAPRKLAYGHDRNIFLADLDGTHAKKLTGGALPDISSDGTRVAFNSEGDAIDGKNPKLIMKHARTPSASAP